MEQSAQQFGCISSGCTVCYYTRLRSTHSHGKRPPLRKIFRRKIICIIVSISKQVSTKHTGNVLFDSIIGHWPLSHRPIERTRRWRRDTEKYVYKSTSIGHWYAARHFYETMFRLQLVSHSFPPYSIVSSKMPFVRASALFKLNFLNSQFYDSRPSRASTEAKYKNSKIKIK